MANMFESKKASGGITPSGTINISTNGVHDVATYADANVLVQSSGTETVLWTNPSPTSQFATQTITVSDLSEYDYIRVYFRVSKSIDTELSVIMSKADFYNSIEGNTKDVLSIGATGTTGSAVCRQIYNLSNTQIKFGSAFTSSGINNDYAIPTKVSAIRGELDFKGALEEELLWTNSSPTSSFSGQTVTLSKSIANYDYIKFVWKYAYSLTELESIMASSDFVKKTGTVSYPQLTLGGRGGTGTLARQIRYSSDTQIRFTDCNNINETGVVNNDLIPVAIYGCNLRVATSETSLWRNSSPTSTMGETAVTLSDSISNYDYLKIRFRRSTTNDTQIEVIYPKSTVNTCVTGDSIKMGCNSYSTYYYYRTCAKQSETSLLFSTCKNSEGTIATGGLIPLEVIGIKGHLGGGNMILDFANAVSMTGNFTAPFDGAVIGRARTTASAGEAWLADSKNFALIPSASSNISYVNLCVHGIKKGTVFSGITDFATNFAPSFVPYV